MKAIVAIYNDLGIGIRGDQPLALKADREFFYNTTKNSIVIMGRKTLEALPDGKPLSNRVNIVLSRTDEDITGCVVMNDIASVLSYVKIFYPKREVFVIGGAEVYSQLIEYCDEVLVTQIGINCECDKFFPDIINNKEHFIIEEETPTCYDNEIPYKFLTYKNLKL